MFIPGPLPAAAPKLFAKLACLRIRDLQISHFEKCDPAYGAGVAKAIEAALAAKEPKGELVGA